MRERFSKEVSNLKQLLQEMSALTECAILKAVKSMPPDNTHDADEILRGDAFIDAMEVRIEEECLKLIALYQPVASDLRKIITILKVNVEIERAADFAVSIANRALDMQRYTQGNLEIFDFGEMAKKAEKMFKDALDAFVYGDVLRAYDVLGADDAVDDIHRGNYDKVKSMILRYPDEAGYYLDCLTVSRALERIADIATNICEDVIYLEQGKIIRHQTKPKQPHD